MPGVAESVSGVEPTKRKPTLFERLRRGAIGVGAALIVVYAVYFAVAGGKDNLLLALADLDPFLLLLPLAATALSYITMSLSYEGIVRAAGANVGSMDMLRITFIANTANYMLPSGGLSGFALRLIFFTKRGIKAGSAVLISFTQTLLTNLMLMLFIAYGLVNLLFVGQMRGASLLASVTLAVLLAASLVISLMMIYHRPLRIRVLEAVENTSRGVLRWSGHEEKLSPRVKSVLMHIGEGMELFAANPKAMIAPSIWIFLDWLFTTGVLYSGFYAVGYDVTLSQVVIGFSVGIFLSIISFVPGGAGVLEGSLAATFSGLGIPLKDSLLPIFIFRMCFYVVPGILSMILARGAFAEVVSDDVDESVAEQLL